jgi:hypothetical protein
MDFGLTGVAGNIASSTGSYLGEFAPVFLLIAGIVLAFGVIDRLVDSFRGGDTIPDNTDRYQ